MLAHLGQVLPQAQLHGTDLHPLAIAHAAARQAGTLTQSSANALPYRDAAFDAVLAMDVYYVREVDDVRALHEAHRVLKPGGLLLMNLPAFELLRGEHDLAVHTRHRYTAPELAQMLHAAGFSVLRLTYWNALLFPLLLARRQLRRPPAGAAPRSDLTPLPAFINACFGALLGVERFLLAHVNLPFGSSVFAVARKINPPRGIG